MRRPLPLALAAAAALLAAGCSKSPCQELGERLCSCTGLSGETCTTQVQDQLNRLDPPQSTMDRCSKLLSSCNPPPGAALCEWMVTPAGKVACGLAEPEPTNVTTTTAP